MRRAGTPWLLVTAVLVVICASACDDGVGGPAPCLEDPECEPVCDAFCASAEVTSATCDGFLRACVCECNDTGAGGNGGQGGTNGGECPGGTVVQELVQTEIQCDVSQGVDLCLDECPLQCLIEGYALAPRGAACITVPPAGDFCDCLCARCE